MNNKILVGIVLFLLAFSTNILAIGISPGKTTLDFSPNSQQEISFKVLNNEKKDMDVLLYVGQSELSSIVILYDSIVSFKSEEESKEFKYAVKFPSTIEEPGDHEMQVIALEIPKGSSGNNFVGATAAVATVLNVRVPYPGKYAKIDLAVSDSKIGEDMTFVVPTWNLGTDDIINAQASIDILGPTNEKIVTLNTEKKGIKSKSKTELVAKWNADVNAGKYFAVATLTYDGKTARAEKIFALGDLFIDIVDISVKDFNLGEVAKFNILIENKWNDVVTNVVPEIKISDKDGNEVASFKGAGIDVDALSKAELNAYWDTEGVKEGVYDGRAILHYSGKTTEKQLKTDVSLNGIKVSFLGQTAQAVKSGGSGRNSILVTLVIILIIINIGWFIYIKRIKRP